MRDMTVPRGTPTLIDREARRRHLAAADAVEPVLRPVILVPTPAQIARGERVIDAPPGFAPDAAVKLAEMARAHGWETRLTYSHVLAPPKRGGEDWREQHVICVRLRHHVRELMAFAAWIDGKPDGSQIRGHDGTSRLVTVTDLAYVLRDEPIPVTERGPCTACAKEIRFTQAGAPYAHKLAGAPCPGRRA